jgi:hypothetical protein
MRAHTLSAARNPASETRLSRVLYLSQRVEGRGRSGRTFSRSLSGGGWERGTWVVILRREGRGRKDIRVDLV